MLATNKGVTVSAAEAMIYNALTRVKGMAVDAQSVTFSVWMADAGYDDFYAFSTILLGLVERGIVLREDWVYYLPGTAKAIQLQEEYLPDAHFVDGEDATAIYYALGRYWDIRLDAPGNPASVIAPGTWYSLGYIGDGQSAAWVCPPLGTPYVSEAEYRAQEDARAAQEERERREREDVEAQDWDADRSEPIGSMSREEYIAAYHVGEG